MLKQPEKIKAEMLVEFEEMWEGLYGWRGEHPEASFDEIVGQVTPRRRALMGKMMKHLACHQGDGEVLEGLSCPECGQKMEYKGKPKREISHLEGETEMKRAYYHCAQCESGIFPPR